MKQVFLSYARLNSKSALRLFTDLTGSGSVKVWFDREDLLPGLRWRPAIRKAIRESDFFVALFSREAVTKRGFRNSELRDALDVMREFPDDQIFLIPVRLDECNAPVDEIDELTYADLFPEWNDGVQRLKKSIGIKATSAVAKAAKPAKQGHHYKVGLVDVGGSVPELNGIARGLSRVQRFFGFVPSRVPMPAAASKTIGGEKQFYIDSASKKFHERVAPLDVDFAVCVTDRYIAFDDRGRIVPGYISSESPITERVQFISSSLLPDYSAEAGISFKAALAHMIAGQLVAHFLDMEYHPETRDCPMDFDANLHDLVGGLRKGSFCKVCINLLKKNPDLLAAVNALISWGR